MKGMIKIEEFLIEETGGRLMAMAIMTPPDGFIMTLDRGCIPCST